jgi:hypothetical protein
MRLALGVFHRAGGRRLISIFFVGRIAVDPITFLVTAAVVIAATAVATYTRRRQSIRRIRALQ